MINSPSLSCVSKDPKRFGNAVRRLLSIALLFVLLPALNGQQRWTEDQAKAWYAKQPWLVGANFLPSTASNELEMWQAETYDPTTIDRELGWAENIGMNTMRVFLHNLVYEQDPKAFEKRIDGFLDDCRASPYTAGSCALRFLLGSAPKTGTAASASAGCAQLALGAGSRDGCSSGPDTSSTA